MIAGSLACAAALVLVLGRPPARLRRRAFERVPTLIAAEVPILAVEGTLAAATAAAGLRMTVTGTVGGLCFLAWAGADRLWLGRRMLSA